MHYCRIPLFRERIQLGALLVRLLWGETQQLVNGAGAGLQGQIFLARVVDFSIGGVRQGGQPFGVALSPAQKAENPPSCLPGGLS